MLKSNDDKAITYVGYTKNIKERITLHNSGKGPSLQGVDRGLYL